MSEAVRLERAGSIGWVVFDNPARRNALTAGMLEQAVAALAAAAADDAVRVVVLRGADDKAFISGADITAFGSPSGVDAGVGPEQLSATIAGLGKPVIAALRGWCLGAGVLVALAADLRVAGDDVRMGIPAAKLGVAYPSDGVARIVAVAGPAVAAQLLMTGEPVDADVAQRAGLVDRVVPAPDVFDAATRLADTLAANAPLSLVAAKRTIAAALRPGDRAAAEASDAAIAACYRSEDFAEGRQAFAEKRPPAFRGR